MTQSLYCQLAEQFSEQIRSGLRKPGERLPSVRKQAELQGVSITTVVSAYSLLEQQGWVEVRPKSGYYICECRQSALSPPAAVRAGQVLPVAAAASRLAMTIQKQATDPANTDFSRAVPDPDLAVTGQLRRTFTRISRTAAHLGQGYDGPEGVPELRQQIARHCLDAGVSVPADHIVTTNGCINALNLSLQVLTRPGDTVAVESPCYYGTLQMIESLGLKALEIPVDPVSGLSLEALELALEQWPVKALLLIGGFSNPLGCSMADERKKALIGLLNRYDIPLLEDDVYGDLSFAPQRPRSIKSFDTENRVLLCSSLSKTLDPQLRVGWVLAGRYYDQILHRKFVNMIASPVLPQMACADFLGQGVYDRHLRYIRELYRRRYQQLADLAGRYFPETCRMSRPEGGIVCWFELPEGSDATELYRRALAERIVITPGEIYSLNSQRFRHCFRVSYARDWTPERVAGIRRLGQCISDYLNDQARKC